MTTLLIATRNSHKLEELRAILGGHFRYVTLNDWPNPPEVVEDAGTFAGNATKKSVELAKWASQADRAGGATRLAGGFVLADDSGLEVDALGGAPGVHSARFAAVDSAQPGNSPPADNNAKLLRLLKGVPLEKRTARFRCVLALTPLVMCGAEVASPVCYAEEAEFETELFEGICEGRIEFALKGERGFGYDPLFVPAGFNETFGELSEAIKNRMSHRARALDRLKAWLGRRA